MLGALKIIAAIFLPAKLDPAAEAELARARAQDAWRQAGLAYRQAKNRGDTRSQNSASRALRDAAHAALRVEIGARH